MGNGAANILVRPASLDDAQAVAEINVVGWQTAYDGLMPREFLLGLDGREKARRFERAFKQANPNTSLVAEQGKRVVGFCTYGPSRDADALPGSAGELIAIYVHPRHLRRGIGETLLTRVIEDMQARAWSDLTLWVLRENYPARAFYEKTGFEYDHIEKRDSALTGTPLHEVRYRFTKKSNPGDRST